MRGAWLVILAACGSLDFAAQPTAQDIFVSAVQVIGGNSALPDATIAGIGIAHVCLVVVDPDRYRM
jgi:hypothetical protein